MPVARLILAILIAVSVATAPATSMAISASPAKMAIADHTNMPCCPAPDDAKGSVACAFKCLSFVAVMFPAASPLVHVANGLPLSLSDRILRDHITPPTHPPPI